jgi:catecholate siderophore receptor
MMIPRFSSNLWSTYRLGDGWEVGGGYSQATTRWMNTGNTGQVPGYTIFNAMIGYVQRSYDVRVNLYNLTNKTYYVAGYENNPAFVLPGAPRTGSITVRYRFD